MGNSEIMLLIVRCQQNITTTSEARGNSHSKLQADGWIGDWGEATYLGTSLLQCSSSSTNPGSGESPVSCSAEPGAAGTSSVPSPRHCCHAGGLQAGITQGWSAAPHCSPSLQSSGTAAKGAAPKSPGALHWANINTALHTHVQAGDCVRCF